MAHIQTQIYYDHEAVGVLVGEEFVLWIWIIPDWEQSESTYTGLLSGSHTVAWRVSESEEQTL